MNHGGFGEQISYSSKQSASKGATKLRSNRSSGSRVERCYQLGNVTSRLYLCFAR